MNMKAKEFLNRLTFLKAKNENKAAEMERINR